MTGLEFAVQDVYLDGLSVERGPMKPPRDRTIHAQIRFDVPSAEFTPGETTLRIVTRYTISLYLQDPEQQDEPPPGDAEQLIGTVVSSYAVNVESSELVRVEHAETGALEPATDAAAEAAHPYHRAIVESHTPLLGVTPFRLPVQWRVVVDSLQSAN